MIHRIIKEKNNLNIIEQLNDYIYTADKEWRKKIQGIDKDTVEQLILYAGFQENKASFIQYFKEYMIYAGKDDGGLFEKILLGKISAKGLLEKYTKSYKNNKMLLPANEFELLSLEGTYDKYIYKLKKVEDNYYVEEEINEGGNDITKNYISSSFEKLLFQLAARQYEEKNYMNSYEVIAEYSYQWKTKEIRKEKELFDLLDSMTEKYKMIKPWFNDEYFYFAYNDTMSILVWYSTDFCEPRAILSGNEKDLIRNFWNKYRAYTNSSIIKENGEFLELKKVEII